MKEEIKQYDSNSHQRNNMLKNEGYRVSDSNMYILSLVMNICG